MTPAAILCAAVAFADPAGGGSDALPIRLGFYESAPALEVDTEPGTEIRLSMTIQFGELRYSWEQSPVVAGEAHVLVPINVPEAAFLHSKATDYVSDVIVYATVGNRTWVDAAALAWPNGPDQAVVLWTYDELPRMAPQGVLRSELRSPVLADGDRYFPDVSDVIVVPADLNPQDVSDEP